MMMANYPLPARLVSLLFRNGLLGLSLLCTALLLTYNINNYAEKEAAKQAQLAVVDEQVADDLTRFSAQQEQQRAQYKQQQQQSLQRLDQALQALENDRKAEMGVVVRGEFKGKRYREIQAQIEAKTAEREAMRVKQLKELAHYEAGLREEYEAQRQRLEQQATAKKQHIDEHFDPDASGTNNVMVVSLLEAFKSLIPGWAMKPSQFVLLFAVLFAVLIELGIILAFENIMLAIAPLLKVQARNELEQEVLKTELSAEQEKDGLRHEADLAAIRRRAQQAVEKARGHFDDDIFKATR